MEKAIIYTRSKATVSDFGLPALNAQFQTCKEYAEKNNIQIVGLYSDIATLGYKPKYLNWRAIVNTKNPKYDYILTYDYSRVGRNLTKLLKERTKLKEHGVRIISVTDNKNKEDDDWDFELIEQIFKEHL